MFKVQQEIKLQVIATNASLFTLSLCASAWLILWLILCCFVVIQKTTKRPPKEKGYFLYVSREAMLGVRLYGWKCWSTILVGNELLDGLPWWFKHPWSIDDMSYSLKIPSHNTLEDVNQKNNFAMDSVSCAVAYIFFKPVFVYILADWRH